MSTPSSVSLNALSVKAQSLSHGKTEILSLGLTGAAILVSVLQGCFFILDRSGSTMRSIAIAVAALNVSIAIGFLLKGKSNRLFTLVIVPFVIQLTIFSIHLKSLQPPIYFRLLQVAITLTYAASILVTFLVFARILVPAKAVLLSVSAAVAILGAETILSSVGFSVTDPFSTPLWIGTMGHHPVLGDVYNPHSTLKTFYPDNARGYFNVGSPEEGRSWLRAAGGNEAKLEFFPQEPRRVTINISKLESKAAFDAQLNFSHFKVQSKHEYTVTFRARTTSPRTALVGFARSHEPWDNLGLYSEVSLTPEWQQFERSFWASADDDNARIHFDVGNDQPAIDFSDVSLRSLPDQTTIEPDLRLSPYSVTYEFNALGCRGPDYEIPKPSDTSRVLVLGDSYTLGSGVHQQDTFASKLNNLLGEETKQGRNYEVINCGVSGYGTREEHLFYQLFGSKYQPDIVLVTMVWNDDMSFLDELQAGYYNREPGKFEYLFLVWGKLQEYRYQHPSPDFTKSAQELLNLNDEVRKQGARLAVVIFRNDSDYTGATDSGRIWKLLTDTITAKLQGTGIPILDLSKALYKEHNDQELMVHPVVDPHPNEIAHDIAGREIFSFLKEYQLVGP